jgi:hypothetical protein
MARGRPVGSSEAAQLARAGPIIPGQRPEPPADLEEDQAREWRSITARLPADWFTSENQPLLRELCRHICYARELAIRIAALRDRILKDGGDLLGKSEEWRALREILQLHRMQSRSIADLATKLRLTQQSRIERQTAEDEQHKIATAGGPAPWDDWGVMAAQAATKKQQQSEQPA